MGVNPYQSPQGASAAVKASGQRAKIACLGGIVLGVVSLAIIELLKWLYPPVWLLHRPPNGVDPLWIFLPPILAGNAAFLTAIVGGIRWYRGRSN